MMQREPLPSFNAICVLQVRNVGLQGAVLKQTEAQQLSNLHSIVLRDCSFEASIADLSSLKVLPTDYHSSLYTFAGRAVGSCSYKQIVHYFDAPIEPAYILLTD